MTSPDAIEIRKYANKKYYVGGWGVYLTLGNIAGLICRGDKIRVFFQKDRESPKEDVTAETIAKAIAQCFEQLDPLPIKQEVGCQWMSDTLRHCFTFKDEDIKGHTIPVVSVETTGGDKNETPSNGATSATDD